jgi:transposase
MMNFTQERRAGKVVAMIKKHNILLLHYRDGPSIRQISRKTGISRPTVTKYIAEYAEHKQRLSSALNGDVSDEAAEAVIRSLTEPPHYDSSSRTPRKVTTALRERLQTLLTENAEKRSRGQHKQQLKVCDMHELLQSEGYTLSYSQVGRVVKTLTQVVPESFIRQTYAPGEVCEFDWGEVQLRVAGTLTRFQMAIFTSACGNYRYAWLTPTQDTAAFQLAHALFFEHIGGVYRTLVYDNMKVAVKRFVGPSEKEATPGLLSLATYYQFGFRFCNVRRGNEKGHVERSVEYVRRKAFAPRDEFDDLLGANQYLGAVCTRLNARVQPESGGQTAQEMLEAERPYLGPVGPRFECGEVRELRVDTYSTIRIDTCRYSVPETYVGQMIQVRVSPDRIRGYVNGECVCQHPRCAGRHEWRLTLTHYVQTLSRKPGALAGSVALRQLDMRLQAIYAAHYVDHAKDFIALLRYMSTSGTTIAAIETVLGQLVQTGVNQLSTDMIKVVCERTPAPPSTRTATDIDRAVAAQLTALARLLPNPATVQGGPVL